ncbi:uncharacterized protein BYT42DRAFT_579136 [Radiomyces spectabilis]|uniref:uncharacterized protein n=1 Tax=Radiomyces spectabilis TaxID=64574 RepID=UPI00221F0945|nr:uncharacterized protein BYT42DRAFT_579136 [Radiomyces spectabilis]KAI8373085.1 hypothetical protein BYT42DRAFT_579136 [Radiomyces spectabilis]
MIKQRTIDIPTDFHDKRVCRDYLCGFCPYDFLRDLPVNYGSCPSVHSPILKANYEKAVQADPRQTFESDHVHSTERFISSIRKRASTLHTRLHKLPKDKKQARTMRQTVDKIYSNLLLKMDQVERLGDEGKVTEAMEALKQVKELRRNRQANQEQLHSLNNSEGHTNNVSICDICAVYLPADKVDTHNKGETHLKFFELRQVAKELKDSHLRKSIYRQSSRADRSSSKSEAKLQTA